jgi:hypothetical protein
MKNKRHMARFNLGRFGTDASRHKALKLRIKCGDSEALLLSADRKHEG